MRRTALSLGRCLAMQYMQYCLLLSDEVPTVLQSVVILYNHTVLLRPRCLMGPRQVPFRRALEMHVRKP